MASTKALKESISQKNAKIKELELLIDQYQSQPTGNYGPRIRQLEIQVENLEAEKARLEKELNETKESLLSLQTSNDELQTAHGELQTSHDELQTSHGDLQTSHDELSLTVKKMKVKECILIMGQVGQDFQENCYVYIFAPKEIPQDIRSNIRSYNVNKLTRDIHRTKGLTKKQKKEANERWETLIEDLEWDDVQDLRTIKELKELRNVNPGPAHPELTQEKVEKAAADFLSEKPHFSSDNLQKLKRMWLITLEKKKNVPLTSASGSDSSRKRTGEKRSFATDSKRKKTYST